jgi:predicted ATPase
MSSATSSSQNEDAGSNGIPRTINTAGVTSNSRNTSSYGGIAGGGHGDNTSTSFSLSSSGYSTYDNNGSLLRLSSNRNNYNNSANMILQEMTVNKLQFDKLHCLYGRSEHLKELNHVVSKLMSNKTQKEEELCEHPQRRQLVLLQGEAGSGKSTLARSVLRKLDQQDASLCICKGKFDVILKDEPYSGIGEACRELVRNLLAQVEETRGESHPEGEEEDGDNDSNDAASARRRSSNCANVSATANKIVEDLRIALGHDAVLLYSLIPNLRLLLDGSNTLNAAAAVATSGGATAVVTTAGTPHNDDDPRTTTTSNANEGYTEAKARFQHVFRRFIRALSSPPSPSSGNNGGDNDDANDKDDDTHSGDRKLIFILDDIHWADAYSLELLESILTDSENKSGALLVIATFRSEQISHELNQSLQRIESSLQGLCGLTTIALENWQIPDLTAMLADLLNESRPETVFPLADCVHRKTHGNIFFSIQFLRTLFETGKLTYQFGLCKWTWDDPTNILQQMSSTENVIQLLTEKLKVLPNGIYTLLPAIACIGAQFRGVIVEFIVAHWNEFFGHKSSLNKKDETNATSDYTDEEPDKCLTNAKTIYNSQEVVNTLVDSGLIVVVGKDQYRWEHDKVQEAALSLLEPFELAELQYIIGDILLDKLTKSQLEEMLFVVSDLLDQHPNLAKLPKKKRERIRELNLDAGRKARESSALHAASVYLRRGIKLLDADCWVTDYDLALHVYSASAEAK